MKPWEKYQDNGPWAKYAQPKQATEKPLDPTEDMSFGEKALAGAGKAFVDVGRAVRQMKSPFDGVSIRGISAPSPVAPISQAEVDEAKKLDAPLMETGGGLTGNIGANLLAALVPGGNSAPGAALVGAGLSALQPTATGESRLQNTAIGGALGAGGALAAKGIGKLQGMASNRVAALADKVQAKAAADAAAETASARSAAGRAAQDTYKQMEHLRELDAVGALTPEQSKVFKELSEELAQKAQEKLMPSAAFKKETAQAYRDAIETEADRAAKLANDRLSGKEAKNQAMARLKRYGPAAVGGALGGALMGGVGAAAGIPIGLYLRPALHSMRRLAQNPAVQYQALKPIANSGLLGDLSDPRVLGLLAPSIYAAQQ